MQAAADVSGEFGFDQRFVQARRGIGRAAAQDRQRGGARQDRIQRYHRRKVGIFRGRGVIGQFDVGGRSRALDRHAPFAALLWLDRGIGRDGRTAFDFAEALLDLLQHVLRAESADGNCDRVIRRIIRAIVGVEIVARHRLQVAQMPDRLVAIAMRAKRRGLHFFTQ